MVGMEERLAEEVVHWEEMVMSVSTLESTVAVQVRV